MTQTLLAIDPSTTKIGWAIFTDQGLRKYGTISPPKVKTPIKAVRRKDWWSRTKVAEREISSLIERYRPTKVIIEQPQIFQSKKGQAASNSSSIIKLCIAAGVYAGSALGDPRIEVVFTPVNQWKGTVPKHITQRRVLRRYGVALSKTVDNNAIDAIGIGDWYLRKRAPNA